MKAAIYCRVSTREQNVEAQEQACIDYCERQEIEIYGVYSDNGISGSLDKRPAFNEMITDMRRYKFNIVVVTKLDRIGRSLQHLLTLFDEFKNKGVNFAAVTQSIDTTSPQGKLFFQIQAAFAEYEREIISERTREGIKYSKNRHKVGMRGPDLQPRKSRKTLRKKVG